MPVAIPPVSSSTIDIYRSASSLPRSVWNAFKADPCNSNIIYSHALKALKAGQPDQPDQVWITCTTNDTLDFILSCTGIYPIFIYSALPATSLDQQTIFSKIYLLANALHECVNVERVYSVFSVDMISRAFATIWFRITQIGTYSKPYYHANFTFCTETSFKARQFTTMPGLSYELRLAIPSDIPAAAKLCYGFAAEADPFVLTMEGAIREATLLINHEQLWVHTIRAGDRPSEIASIVAVTRESDTVSAITKVFTNPDWRSRRCAERLVRKVTQILLKTRHKESVVLYVGHNNPAASKVYNRVGFVGLDSPPSPVAGVDSWLELGFDRNKVELGHW